MSCEINGLEPLGQAVRTAMIGRALDPSLAGLPSPAAVLSFVKAPEVLAMHSHRRFTLFAVVCLTASFTPHIFSQSKPAKDSGQDERVHHIETDTLTLRVADNEPPLALDLAKLMQLYKVPAISIAVIDNFQISWAKAYGVIEPSSTTPVTTKTLFQAGSISKPVAATAALYLVQEGKLSLDENVNDKLKTWKVPENEFTKTEKVTLRRLMSHTAGLTVHG